MISSIYLHGMNRIKAVKHTPTGVTLTLLPDRDISITLCFQTSTEAHAYADAINGTTEALDEADKMQESVKLEAVA